MFDQAIDAFSEDALQVTLSWPTAGIRRHHARNRGISSKERPELGGRFELSRKNALEHREEKMFFSAFVLVSVKCKHNSL